MFLPITLLVSIILSSNLVEACSCSKHEWEPFSSRKPAMSYLSNFRELNSLSFVTTHSSYSYLIKDPLLQTQDFEVRLQMKYGVRGLDVGVYSSLGSFEIYVGDTALNITFDDVLDEVNEFLNNNPWELMILMISRAHDSVRHSKNYCRVLNRYLSQQNGGRLVTKWQLNDTIGLHRGKILVASLDPAFRECAFPIRENCLVNDDQDLDQEKVAKFGAVAKWSSLARFTRIMARGTSNCYVNDVSFAYKGNLDRKTLARDAGYRQFDNSCAQPLNLDAMELFKKPRGFLVMLFDFICQKVIDTVIDANYGDSSWRSGLN
ncbi:Protein of unknown function [Cotesia congregata]|uniref:Phosphatidylinositol-specific phospholipase C X domain-containing protein n=1 Tax=Cotesia congregata TaxID=51543 RepID=A0A8J2E3L5_COTCN|nr:Protein of unknown function [Cotesia congregata]